MLVILQFPKGNIIDPNIVKHVDTLRANIFAKEMGWNKAVLKGDALQVVQALQKEGQNWCHYSKVIDDFRIVLQSLIQSRVSHVR